MTEIKLGASDKWMNMGWLAILGTIAPIGVMLALAYTLVLLPAILAIIPVPPAKKKLQAGLTGALTRALVRLGDYSVDHAGFVLAMTAVFVVFFAVGASQARFSHLATDWFQEGDPFRESSLLLVRELRGTMSLEVLLDTGRENGLHDPEVLRRIEAAMRRAETIDTGDVYIGKATSIVDIVKETNRALNENRPEFYRIPDDREAIAQELLLFENTPEQNRGFRTAKVRSTAYGRARERVRHSRSAQPRGLKLDHGRQPTLARQPRYHQQRDICPKRLSPRSLDTAAP